MGQASHVLPGVSGTACHSSHRAGSLWGQALARTRPLSGFKPQRIQEGRRPGEGRGHHSRDIQGRRRADPPERGCASLQLLQDFARRGLEPLPALPDGGGSAPGVTPSCEEQRTKFELKTSLKGRPNPSASRFSSVRRWSPFSWFRCPVALPLARDSVGDDERERVFVEVLRRENPGGVAWGRTSPRA